MFPTSNMGRGSEQLTTRQFDTNPSKNLRTDSKVSVYEHLEKKAVFTGTKNWHGFLKNK